MTSQALNRPVDVLSWIRNTPADNGWKAKERDAVANAVAELIEAAEVVSNRFTGADESLRFSQRIALSQLRAAIAAIEVKP